jgi:type I restriction enzyme M protein
VLVNASAEFKKGQPKNYIPEDGIHKIADAFIAGEDVANFVKVIGTEEAAKNDFNLSPSRYVGAATDETYREIPEIVAELKRLEQKATKITKELDGIIQQLNQSRTAFSL